MAFLVIAILGTIAVPKLADIAASARRSAEDAALTTIDAGIRLENLEDIVRAQQQIGVKSCLPNFYVL